MIQKFSESVIKELGYYVYRLIDPRNGETFYIGKGKGNRVFQHVLIAQSLLKEVDDEMEEEDEVSLKYGRIREINKAGLDVIHIIHRHNMTAEVALEVEAALIDAFSGLTNLVSGKGNDFGPMNAIEIERKYLKEEVDFGEDKVLMITINRTISEKSIYDAVRFAWRINVNRAKQADYVLAIEKGEIMGVFVAHEWKLAREQHFPGFVYYTNKRSGFIGEEASEEIKKKYMNKRIPDSYRKKGAVSPVKYNYE